MNRTTKVAGLAMAALIGLGALGTAQAAPFAGTGSKAGIAVERGIDTVSEERRGGRRDRRHRRGHRHGFHRPGRHWYRPHCFHKRVRVYDPFFDGFVYTTRLVCPRRY